MWVNKKEFTKLQEDKQRLEGELETMRSRMNADAAQFQKKVDDIVEIAQELSTELAEKDDTIKELEAELENLRKNAVITEGKSSVTVELSDDLNSITPIIRYNEKAPESLFQQGLIDDSQTENQFAIQLALLTLAHDGLLQLLESFEEKTEDE